MHGVRYWKYLREHCKMFPQIGNIEEDREKQVYSFEKVK